MTEDNVSMAGGGGPSRSSFGGAAGSGVPPSFRGGDHYRRAAPPPPAARSAPAPPPAPDRPDPWPSAQASPGQNPESSECARDSAWPIIPNLRRNSRETRVRSLACASAAGQQSLRI